MNIRGDVISILTVKVILFFLLLILLSNTLELKHYIPIVS